MAEKEYTWHKLGDTRESLAIPEHGLLETEIAGKKLCIALVKDQLFACTALCPHAGGHMAQGYTDALGNIVCPIHRYKFDLRNGRNSSGEGYFLKTFPVQVREDGIFVGFEKSNLFGRLK